MPEKERMPTPQTVQRLASTREAIERVRCSGSRDCRYFVYFLTSPGTARVVEFWLAADDQRTLKTIYLGMRWHGPSQRHIVPQKPQLFRHKPLLFWDLLAYCCQH